MNPDSPLVSESSRPQKSILEPPTVSFPKGKPSKLKNFLFWFFVVEHIIIVLLILSLSFFYVKTYAYSDFGVLDEKARAFAPQPSDSVSSAIINRFTSQIPSNFSPQSQLDAKVDLTESEVSSFVANLNIDHVKKSYVGFNDNNEVLVWILPSEVDQAFMFSFVFEYKNESVDVTTKNVQFGPIPLPTTWVGFIEESIENSANNYVQNAKEESGITVNDIKTENGKMIIDMHFDNPKEAAEVLLQ